MNLSQVLPEEKLFLRRLEDLRGGCERRSAPTFTHFLTERQVLLAEAYAQQAGVGCFMLWGGWDGAVRKIMGFFPDYMQPELDTFPIVALELAYKSDAALTHRDFLGTFMSLGITRESVGDILPATGRCVAFAQAAAARLILDNMVKVAGAGVKVALGVQSADEIGHDQAYEALRGTLSSVRLDSLISMLTNLSRERSAQLIQSGLVQKNHAVATNGARSFATGDIITIRGHGKFVVDEIGEPTRKKRLPVICRKYK